METEHSDRGNKSQTTYESCSSYNTDEEEDAKINDNTSDQQPTP
jgi:hypothetical protein